MPVEWQGKRVLLEFEGVAVSSQVLCNGSPVAGHSYAYTEFTADFRKIKKLKEQGLKAARRAPQFSKR